jgi:phosphoribosylanthranilate isomerase
MFKIKICGITNVEDAQVAVDAGADAIGMNFYERSSRCVRIEQAREVFWTFDSQLVFRIGVVVNMSPAQIQEIVLKSGIFQIQLHGDESPETVAKIGQIKRPPNFVYELPIIRARRMGADGPAAIAGDLAACLAAGALPSAILVDAMTPGRYGGTGETVSWMGLADYKRWLGDTPLILAGGLTPDNVAEAIRIVRPFGVDVASGVESSPGKKDPAKVRDFIVAAKAAFAAL